MTVRCLTLVRCMSEVHERGALVTPKCLSEVLVVLGGHTDYFYRGIKGALYTPVGKVITSLSLLTACNQPISAKLHGLPNSQTVFLSYY